MNPHQIALVQSSFAQVARQPDAAAALFYEQLFLQDPMLRHLFRSDLSDQGRKLMHMIGAAVGLLERPQQLMPILRALGMRHVHYGVREHDYATVGAALLVTLERALGAGWTPEVRDAWMTVYSVIAETMQEAAASVPTLKPAPAAAETVEA